MPRYYFHLTDGNQVLNNHKDIDLSGNAAARDDAMTLARDRVCLLRGQHALETLLQLS
jgi:hypothetical protein